MQEELQEQSVEHLTKEKNREQGWRYRKRFLLFRLTVAALIFLFFAAGVHFQFLPEWLGTKAVRQVLSDNTLAEQLENKIADLLTEQKKKGENSL